MRSNLSIGEFSALTQLSIRTLRHYHRTGVLDPASIDASTGYRYYTADQIPTAQVIHRLRQLDVPLVDIKAIVSTDDPDHRSRLIDAHLRRLEDTLDRTASAVDALRRLLNPGAPSSPVELRSLPERTVAAVRGNIRRADVGKWYSAAMAELDAHVGDDRRGPARGRYANTLFTDDSGEAMVYYHVGQVRPTGRVEQIVLAPVELAVTVHAGGDADITETYGRLGRWVVEHALGVDGPVHEAYLVSPRDGAAEIDWRTEIGWPIFRITD